MCGQGASRSLVVRGVVEVLARNPISSLTFTEDTIFTDEDAQDFLNEVDRWRSQHPGQKLRLKKLRLDVYCGIAFVRALVRALEDADDVSLDLYMDDIILADDVKSILRYPSLRSLSINNISIATMDIFASAPQLQLESFELAGLILEDSASVVGFVKSLNPHSATPSPLSQTPQRLIIVEADGDGAQELSTRLAIKSVAAVEALDEVLPLNSMLQCVNFVGDSDRVPVLPDYDAGFAKTSHIPAPAAIRRSALAMARKAAFLSGVRDGSCDAACRMDSNIVQLIFQYSAPFVVRKINV